MGILDYLRSALAPKRNRPDVHPALPHEGSGTGSAEERLVREMFLSAEAEWEQRLSRMRARLDALELEFAEIRRLRGWRQVELNTLKRVL